MGKRQEIRQRRTAQKRQKQITTVLIISGAALVVLAFLIAPTLQRALSPIGEYVVPEFEERPMTSGNTMGDPNATVVIEEFSDFGCSHCARFSETTSIDLANSYVESGDVYFIFRSVGGLIGSPISPIISEAAYCAGDQNEFWRFHDLVFANQAFLYGTSNIDIDGYMIDFAETLNLDMEEFESCYNGREYREQVAQDELDARRVGVTGTPSFLVNDQLIQGNQDFSVFEEIIQEELTTNSQ